MSSTSVVVRTLKVYYGDDLRRFPVINGQLPPLSTLLTQLARAYALPADSKLKLKYNDEENELATVVSDADLKEAVDIATAKGTDFVRVRITLYSDATKPTPAAAAAPSVAAPETPKSSAPVSAAPAVVVTPQPTASSSSGSTSSSTKSSVNGALVLEHIRAFLADPAVLNALPTTAALFLDTFVSSAELKQAIEFTLDAQPVIKNTALVQLGLSYLDEALPFMEVILAPYRELVNVIGPAGLSKFKNSILTFAPFVLPMIVDFFNTKIDAKTLEAVWSKVKSWSADPTQPFPFHELKVALFCQQQNPNAGGAGAAGGECRFPGMPHGFGHGFGPLLGGLFGGHRGGFGHGHGHGHRHGFGHHAGGFGGGRGCWRRAAEAAAAAAQQNTTTDDKKSSSSPDPFNDLFSGAAGANGMAGLAGLVGSLFGGQGPCQREQAAASSSSSTAAPTTEQVNKDGIHPHVACDGCGASPIKGLRYKCTVCHDYDLCSTCEAKNIHPSDHPLLKMQPPAPGRRGPCDWRKHHGHGGAAHPCWRQYAEAQQQRASQGLSAKFVSDVNMADRTPVAGGSVLIKRWNVINDGSAAWPVGSKLIFTRGDRELVDAEEFSITAAEPGQTVEISAVLHTPTIPGRYQAFFRLATSDRETFGNRLWVDVFVLPENSKPVSASATAPVENASSSSSSSSAPAPESKQPEQSIPIVRIATPSAPAPVVTESEISMPSLEPTAVGSNSPSSAAVPTKYATELSLLNSMGFTNKELNIFLLESKQGDVVAVAEWLLEKMK